MTDLSRLRSFAVIIWMLLNSVAAQPSSVQSLLTEIRSCSFRSIIDIDGPVTLKNGTWAGKPFEKGGAERPRVSLIEEMVLIGDVNNDRSQDAVAFLSSSTGGSGTQVSVALLIREHSTLSNKATVWLGDRVQVRNGSIDSAGVIELMLVRMGNGDAMCCPGEMVKRRWVWKNGSLKELPEFPLGRFSTASLDGIVWRLESWKQGELVDTNTAVTLKFDHDKVNGRSACNQYFARSKNGAGPGEVTIGAVGSTKMMCLPEMMASEERYLRLLTKVTNYRFSFGRLLLDVAVNKEHRSLIFISNDEYVETRK